VTSHPEGAVEAGPDTRPGLHFGIPELEYHAMPGLSSTGVKEMLKSPAHYRWMLEHRVERKAFDVGHAAHAKILGVGLGVVEYPPEHLTPSGNASTKAATVQWAEDQRAAGLVPITPDQAAAVDAMADAVRNHSIAGPLFQGGHPEVSIFWNDPVTDVQCRGRIDYLRPDVAVDLKTARIADPARFGRVAADLGYAEQAAHYEAGLTALGNGGRRFIHVLVEPAPPHHVAVVELDETFRFLAETRVRRAIDLYAECMASGEWPSYPAVIHSVAPPAWYEPDDSDEGEIIL
jgi:hypothetical protein